MPRRAAANGGGTPVLQAGGVLTTSYVVLVLARALRRSTSRCGSKKPVSRVAQSAALALAVCSLLLAGAAVGPLPASLISNPLALKELIGLLITVACGGALAWVLAFRADGGAGADPVERLALVVGGAFERSDAVLRRWPVAGISLLAVAGGFGWALLA